MGDEHESTSGTEKVDETDFIPQVVGHKRTSSRLKVPENLEPKVGLICRWPLIVCTCQCYLALIFLFLFCRD